MRLAGFELRKLLCQKSLVVIFVICAMVNLLLLSFQGAGSYTPGMYLALMEDLSGMTAEDARDRVYEKREVLQEYIFRAEAEYDGEAAEEMAPYTGDVWMERDLLDDVLDELGKVAGYQDYLAGPVTEKTTAYVEEENARYAGLYEELAGTEDIVRQSEIGQELLPAEGWGQAVTEYERILEAGDADGTRLSLVYPGGYYKLMGQDGQRDMVCASLLGVLFCICLAAVFAGDSGCGMDRLIFTTAGGRRDTLRAKKQVSFVTAFLIFVLVYGGDFLMILLKIGMKEWQAHLRSLADFSLCPPDVRLWQYMALLYLVKFAGMWACLCVMRVISFLCRDTFRTVLVSAIVFVLPALVGLLGIDAVNYISLVPLLTGSGILNGFLEGSRILYGILYLLAAAGIIGLSGWYLGRQMRETC